MLKGKLQTKKVFVVTVIIILGLMGNRIFRQHRPHRMINSFETQQKNIPGTATNTKSENVRFRCDGRIYCSQMTSCEEAMFFLKNCPGVKMDGDNNGIPCEKQWCK
jgi:Excalibur calcium-binding domain.